MGNNDPKKTTIFFYQKLLFYTFSVIDSREVKIAAIRFVYSDRYVIAQQQINAGPDSTGLNVKQLDACSNE